jgi:hypothetical protein
MSRSSTFKTLNAIVFYLCSVLLLASCWHRNDYPVDMPVEKALEAMPVQKAVKEAPFNVTQEGVRYEVSPLYSYDLKGLIVSYEHHDGNYSLHRLWNDHLNVADICVLWGDNLQGPDLNTFKFWNGEFTCNFTTADQQSWEQFRPDKISNNHLLAVDGLVRNTIEKVRIGDQVRIRGWLASYSNGQGFSRGTSISREDKGNGACETIYVQEMSILRSMESGWRRLMNFSLFGFIVSGLIWVIAVLRGVF